jgi:ribosomal protein S18 acetylase RimI-like enzyme
MSFKIIKTDSIQDFEICASFMEVSEPWISLGMNMDQCLLAFQGNEKTIYTLTAADSIQGFIILQQSGTFKGYIQTICIKPEERGKGYGTALLQFAEALIFQYSPNIFICVSNFNNKALALYQKFGFEIVGQLPNFVKEGFTEILCRKTIGPMVGYHPIHKID